MDGDPFEVLILNRLGEKRKMKQNCSVNFAIIFSRAGAFIIDWLIAIILGMIIAGSITFLSLVVLNMKGASTYDFVMVQNYPTLIGKYSSVIVFTLYNSLMDSSKYQATIGKKVFNLQAVDINQKRLSFWKALLKYAIMWSIPVFLVGKYILIVIFVMAIPIVFTKKKQGLYDIIAGSLVIKRKVADDVISNQNSIEDEPNTY